MRERVKSLLGSGLSPAVVAAAVGCTESFISQLFSDESFAAEVSELRIASLTAHTNRDSKADAIEDALLEKLSQAVPMMMRPAEIMRAYQTVNAAKRRGSPADAAGTHMQTQIINLNLPTVMMPHFIMSSDNQMVEVGGRPLLTMTAKQLATEAHEHVTNKLQNTTREFNIGAKVAEMQASAKPEATGNEHPMFAKNGQEVANTVLEHI